MMHYAGYIAGLLTAVSWAACAIFFTSASRRIGVFAMNNWRVLIGFCLLLVAQTTIFKSPVPTATESQWMLLISSGVMGIFIGDTFLFQALHDLGPRLGLLLFNISPFMTALIAWPVLREKLGVGMWIGIAVTVTGATWVLAEEHRGDPAVRSPHYARGIICALLAALTCGMGYVIAKPALTGPHAVAPLPATLIRVGASVVCFWLSSAVRGRLGLVARSIGNAKVAGLLLGGAITGPAIGIWLSMVAIKLIPAGIASTLFATMPVVILPMVILFYKERVSWRAALGAAIAVAGVAILFNV